MINIKSAAEIDKMRRAGEIVALAHRKVAEAVSDGITTWELDRIAREAIREKGAQPSFLNYDGFPGSICASVNDVVIHGIPTKSLILKNGDIVGIDIGAYYQGYHGDRAVTHAVGNVSDKAARLIEITERAFWEGIKCAREGCRVGDVSAAVQEFAERHGYSVVREFVGHGVGTKLHESPEVPNFGKPGRGSRLCPGITFAVEPMINEGKEDIYKENDGWTIRTADGSLSAHFEHTIAVTKNDPLILTI